MAAETDELEQHRVANMTLGDRASFFDYIPWDNENARLFDRKWTDLSYQYFTDQLNIVMTPIITEDTATEAKGQTILHVAIGHRSPAVVKSVVAEFRRHHSPADQNNLWRLFRDHRDVNGMTALNLAAHCNDLESTIALIGAGAGTSTDAWNNNELHNAVLSEGTTVLKHLLGLPPWTRDLLNIRGHEGLTPLNMAARGGDLQSVKALIVMGAQISEDNHGNNAIHNAALAGQTIVAQYLVHHPYWRQNIPYNLTNNDGETYLHLAARSANDEIARLLAPLGVDVNHRSNNGFTAAHIAAEGGHVKILSVLFMASADFMIPAYNADGLTALHIACVYGQLNAVKYLVSKQVDVNKPDRHSNMPLHYAMRHNWPDIVRLLMERGAAHTAQNEDFRVPEEEGIVAEAAEAIVALRSYTMGR